MPTTDDMRVHGNGGRNRHGCGPGRKRFGRGGMWRWDEPGVEARADEPATVAASAMRVPSEGTTLLIERDRLRARLDEIETALRAQGERT